MSLRRPEAVEVLLIEDDDVDAETVQRAFKKNRVANPVRRARDGVEALERLRGASEAPLERPFLILLDLNLPRMTGLQFLREVRDDPILRDSIIFVLTTSDAAADKAVAYDMNVAGYLLKDQLGDGFQGLVDLLTQYWSQVQFPSISTTTGN